MVVSVCKWIRLLFLLVWLGQPAQAIILFGLDNDANQSDPGTGVPFDAVAQVYNTSGGATRGSAIHLGDGYMLTANHVAVTADQSYTFDGVDSYALDTSFTPTQVAAGVDLKVFRLTTVPVASAVTLGSGGVTVTPATMVGWGRGRDPSVPLGSATVAWGDNTTIAKRWGLNTPRDLQTVSYDAYSFAGLITVLGSSGASPAGLGANEAAATQYDSGSALFQQIAGQWRLIGVTVAVEVNGSSFFGNDALGVEGSGHANAFVDVDSYRSQILALVPEPSCALLLVSSLGLLFRRRVTRD